MFRKIAWVGAFFLAFSMFFFIQAATEIQYDLSAQADTFGLEKNPFRLSEARERFDEKTTSIIVDRALIFFGQEAALVFLVGIFLFGLKPKTPGR